MSFLIPELWKELTNEQLDYLKVFIKSCRKTILEMLKNSQSWHPWWSLSALDYLATLYVTRISQTLESLIVSNGHISPAIYSILANLWYVEINDLIENFRKIWSKFEWHVSHKLSWVPYSTWSLWVWWSVAAWIALSNKIKWNNKKVYAVLWDWEIQEWQVWEMINFAKNYNLDNFIVFVDCNRVQLSGAIDDVYPTDIVWLFKAANWHVLNINWHDIPQIWQTISDVNNFQWKPVVIIWDTIMWKWVELMEQDWKDFKSTRHGKSWSVSQLEEEVKKLYLSPEELELLSSWKSKFNRMPEKRNHIDLLNPLDIDIWKQRVYTEINDCRTAYWNALNDLAEKNFQIMALSSDVSSSVMTSIIAKNHIDQYVECWIAENNMVSVAWWLSIEWYIPFVSTFWVFLSSRSKDQIRMNDLNETNVKMFATHCGLSVWEDGKTHHEIDGMTSFLWMPNTMVAEPADANMTDRMVRYFASHYWNVYVRMWRHKMPIIIKEDWSPFYDEHYKYEYWKTDVLIKWDDITVVSIWSTVNEALAACKKLTENNNLSVEFIVASSIKKFDDNLLNSIRKTWKLITVEDHNVNWWLGTMIADFLLTNGVSVNKFEKLWISEYQSSAKHTDLYDNVWISTNKIINKILEFIWK